MNADEAIAFSFAFVVLPSWVAAETVENRPGRHAAAWVPALWVTRVLTGGIVALALLAAAYNARHFGWNVLEQIREHYPELLRGYLMTIVLTVLSFALAMVLGGLMALLRTSDSRALRAGSAVYVEAFRNTPLLVQLIFLFFGLPKLHLPFVGRPGFFLLSPFQAGLIGLTLYTGSYTAEALRSGLLAVDRGQTEAARSLGLDYVQTRLYVVTPQALRISVPLLTSIFSALFRNSALVSVVGVGDLLRTADRIQQQNFQTFELFAVAGLLYLALTLPLAWLSARLERRIAGAR
ncbi:MAG TPA: amino acid ABC transporter permease [Tepidiformaceae bacterium]|nr:amino acid ABC transporter permease [Tepidiformaceae bacterium]